MSEPRFESWLVRLLSQCPIYFILCWILDKYELLYAVVPAFQAFVV